MEKIRKQTKKKNKGTQGVRALSKYRRRGESKWRQRKGITELSVQTKEGWRWRWD